MNTQNLTSLLHESIALKKSGQLKKCIEKLYNYHMFFPDYLDEEGHPVFAREIATILLEYSMWEDFFTFVITNRINPDIFGSPEIQSCKTPDSFSSPPQWWFSLLKKHFRSQTLEQLIDIQCLYPDYKFECIFDIGANRGQSLEEYLRFWSDAFIHSFEPTPSTFKVLFDKYNSNPRAKLNEVCLSNSIGEVIFEQAHYSTMNRIVKRENANSFLLPSITLDHYCKNNRIDKIDFLKIDTEGHDLNVLEGGHYILPQTSFIQVEASMNFYNKYHVSFEEIHTFMHKKGFLLFKIYDQSMELVNEQMPVLRRANLLFVNSKSRSKQ
jgi:FkbM family methyltransferase